MGKKRLDAVIFDFDGVLVDSVNIKTKAFAELYKEYGENIQQQVVSYHLQNKGVSRIRKFEYYQTELLGGSADQGLINELAGKFADIVKHQVISAVMIPGAEQSLIALRDRHIPVYVASGTPQDELTEIVRARNMERYFSGLYGSPRTKPEILDLIINTNGFSPEGCIMVGDAMEDYTAAQNNRCKFIGIAYQSEAELPPDIILLPDLTEFIPNLAEYYIIPAPPG